MITTFPHPRSFSPGRAARRAMTAIGAMALTFVLALVSFASPAGAIATPVGLGTAAPFAVLAGTTVTNTGPTVVNGDLGVSPGSAITGFPPGTINGTPHSADAAAAQAQLDLTAAYNNAAGQTPDTAIVADLGGTTLVPGVYNSAIGIGLTGTVTLNAGGDPNAVFVFQAGSTLVTASASTVLLTNGAQACNVFWQVGSSATLGTNSTFVGSILALTSVTVTTGVNLAGRTLARNGAVTLDTDVITPAACAAPVVVPPTATPTVAPVVTPTVGSAPPLASTGTNHVGVLLGTAAALLLIGASLVATGRGRHRSRKTT